MSRVISWNRNWFVCNYPRESSLSLLFCIFAMFPDIWVEHQSSTVKGQMDMEVLSNRIYDNMKAKQKCASFFWSSVYDKTYFDFCFCFSTVCYILFLFVVVLKALRTLFWQIKVWPLMQQTVLVPLGRGFSDSNPLTNQKALCYVCVISPWEWWLKTPNSRMNEDHSPHSSFGAMFNQNQTQSETKHPSPVWHHDARSVPKKHSLFCYFWFPKKGFTGRIVENESFQWFIILFLILMW